LNGLSEDLNFA